MNEEKNNEQSVDETLENNNVREDEVDDVSFEETEKMSRSEERRRDPKLASEGSQNSNNDISFEDINEDGEVNVKDTVKKLREKIKKLEKEKQEYLNLSQRSRADYVNLKKETDERRSVDRKFAVRSFITDLLPVLDAYDMAQGNKEAWEKVDPNWRIGIEYIFSQFYSILEREGVIPFGKVGEVFDPNLHESIEAVKVTDESENDKIVKVLQKGYKMHDMVLRPARVHVAHFGE